MDGASVETDWLVQLDAHPWRAVTLVAVDVVQPDKPDQITDYPHSNMHDDHGGQGGEGGRPGIQMGRTDTAGRELEAYGTRKFKLDLHRL